MARKWGRRWLGSIPRLTSRSWEEVARELEDFVRKLWDSTSDGLPAGFGKDVTPTDVEAGATGDEGLAESGWASAGHKHGTTTGVPEAVGVRIPEAEGTSLALARGDHVHELVSIRTVGVTVDGGINPLTTGFKGFVPVPFSGTCIGWTLEADQPGNCVIDVWKADRRPVPTNSICTVAKPALVGTATAVGGVAGWTSLTMEAGDIFGFNIDSVDTMTLLTLVVEVRES